MEKSLADCGPQKSPGCPPRPIPFGGPASGLWPLGGAAGAGILQPSCILPNLFTECFQGCNSPGNCGWVTVIGVPTFTGRDVRLDPVGGGAVIYKPLTGVPSVNTTMIVRLRELDAPPTASIVYGFGALDNLGSAINGVRLFGDGTINVLLGPTVYSGAWTPQAGAIHTVCLIVGPDGKPSLFIDQVLIPLALGGPLSPAPFGNAFAVTVLNFGPPDGVAVYYSAFLAKGVFPPTTSFCCPNGQPLP